ncbi:hypothetical protein ACX8XN_13980 [Calditrichota bacterium GD2]
MKRMLLALIVGGVFIQFASAQNAMEFFHLGANLYVRGQLEQAIQAVDQGLQKFPDDPYLKALKEKLEEQKKQQQQQQQQQQNQQKQKEQQQQANENKQDQQKDQQKQQQAQTDQQKKKEMSKEEAERILRALKEENKKFKKEHLRVPAGRKQVEKDW